MFTLLPEALSAVTKGLVGVLSRTLGSCEAVPSSFRVDLSSKEDMVKRHGSHRK